jgi:hypothetical protein
MPSLTLGVLACLHRLRVWAPGADSRPLKSFTFIYEVAGSRADQHSSSALRRASCAGS